MKTKKSKQLTIDAKPLTEEQIAVFVKHYNKHGNFPGSKIPCSSTGKLTTCIGPWMKKKIKEFGGAENLLRNYKCRGALKIDRQIIKPVSSKRKKNKLKEIKDENENWVLPKITFEPPRPLNSIDIAQLTVAQCMRPDIYLSNGRHCDGCEYFETCKNSLKSLPKHLVEDVKKRKKQVA